MRYFNTIPGAAALLLLELLASPLRAQSVNSSPYSAFGFGDMLNTTQVTQAMMGGTGIAVVDPYSVSQINPASYVELQRPVFEASNRIGFSSYFSDGRKEKQTNFNFLGFTLGIPFAKGRWGMALGVMPLSELSYDIVDNATLEGGGSVRKEYTGTGGMNRAFIGLSTALWQKFDSLGNGNRLSIGGNLNYLFGTLEYSRKAIYPQLLGYYNTATRSSLVLNSPTANFGVQFRGDLQKRRNKEEVDNWRYLIGVFSDLETTLKATNSSLVNTFVVGSGGVEFIRDTVEVVQNAKGAVTLPLGFGAGATIHNDKWMLTGEMRWRDWSTVRVDVEGYSLPEQLGTATSYALGGSFLPAGYDRGSFWEMTTYRAGLYYMNDYVQVQGADLVRFGTTFGVSLPLFKGFTRSRVNIGAEFGERNTVGNDIIRERYSNIYLGLSITPEEPWFRKRRIE